MTRCFRLALLFLLTTCRLALGQTSPAAIIAAERAFAAKSLETNTREAFLATMADSALIFSRGMLTLAQPVWENMPADGDTIAWGPDFADLSLGGDLGYTMGPWHIDKAGRQVASGHFVTVWQHQEDGSYQWLIDMGVDYVKAKQTIPTKVKTAETYSQYGQDTRADLLAVDDYFVKAARKGTSAAYGAFVGPATRLLRDHKLPFVGKSAIVKQVEAEPATTYQAQGGKLAESGDLGYVFGTFRHEKGATHGSYLRIWKHEEAAGWRLMVECLLEAPKS